MFLAFFAVKHCSGHFWAPPFETFFESGHGARQDFAEIERLRVLPPEDEHPRGPGGPGGPGGATPATHAILRFLKAGETVCQTLFVPKRAFFTLRTVFQIVCQTLFLPKTAPETLFAPPFMKRVTGLGGAARSARERAAKYASWREPRGSANDRDAKAKHQVRRRAPPQGGCHALTHTLILRQWMRPDYSRYTHVGYYISKETCFQNRHLC